MDDGACPLLAALQLEVTAHLLIRATAVATLANTLPAEIRGVAVSALVAPVCAALEAGLAGAATTTLARLRDAGRTALPGGDHATLVVDSPRLGELGAAAATAVGEGTLRQMLGAVGAGRQGAGSLVSAGLAVASGIGMLALSGSLPRLLQPPDWAGVAVGALLSAWDLVPAVNGGGAGSGGSGAGTSEGMKGGGGKSGSTGGDGSVGSDALLWGSGGCSGSTAVAPLSKASIALAIAVALSSMPINQPLVRRRPGLAVIQSRRTALTATPRINLKL